MTETGMNTSGSYRMLARMEKMGSGESFGKFLKCLFSFLQLQQNFVFLDVVLAA